MKEQKKGGGTLYFLILVNISTERKMVNRKISYWKVLVVREVMKQQEAGAAEISWSKIAKTIMQEDPNIFKGVCNAGRKCMDFYKRNPSLVEIIKKKLEEGEDAELEAAVKNVTPAHTPVVTSAHTNDDDSNDETEGEVVAIPTETETVDIQEVNVNKDGSTNIAMDIASEKELTPDKLADEDYILRKLGYDPAIWTVVSSSARKGEWDAQCKGGKIKKLYSYRLNANVKKRTDEISQQSLLDAFIRHVESKKQRNMVSKVISPKGENIAIISIADLHLGKLAWYKECGGNYDYKICRERYFYIIDSAITYLKTIKNLDKVIFFWSQDFFHYDKLEITTTAGTRQDTDVRWQKLYETGCEMLVDGLTKIQKELEVPVQTFYTRSNHDMQVSFYALQYVYAYFHKDPNIEVDKSPMGRKYVEYGCNLMGFGHGDEEKKRIHQLMQVEEKEAWGRTSNHEWFLGHFHKQMVNDESGVIARYLASPTETDAWHYTSGYVGAQKQAQVFIRNKYEGPTDEHIINILE